MKIFVEIIVPEISVEELLRNYFSSLNVEIIEYNLIPTEPQQFYETQSSEEISSLPTMVDEITESGSDHSSSPRESANAPQTQIYAVTVRATEQTVAQILAYICTSSVTATNVKILHFEEGTYPLEPDEIFMTTEVQGEVWYAGIYEDTNNHNEIRYNVARVLARYFITHPDVREKFVCGELDVIKFKGNLPSDEYTGQVRTFSRSKLPYKNPYQCLAKLISQNAEVGKKILDDDFFNLTLVVKKKLDEVDLIFVTTKFLPGLVLVPEQSSSKKYEVSLDFASILILNPSLLNGLKTQEIIEVLYEVRITEDELVPTGNYLPKYRTQSSPRGLMNPCQSFAAAILRNATIREQILTMKLTGLSYFVKPTGDDELQPRDSALTNQHDSKLPMRVTMRSASS